MKYNLIRRIIIALICIVQVSKAQTDNDNHRKYWYYKSRLNNDFVKVGLNAGESIPAQQRGADNSTGTFGTQSNADLIHS